MNQNGSARHNSLPVVLTPIKLPPTFKCNGLRCIDVRDAGLCGTNMVTYSLHSENLHSENLHSVDKYIVATLKANNFNNHAT